METLLMVAVILIALAVIAQAGVLIAMYLMSRRIANKAEALMDDSRKIMSPLESVTNNLKLVADDLAVTGKIAREQASHIQEIVAESQQTIRGQITEVHGIVMDTVEEARVLVMAPIRQYNAIAVGIAEGLRTFFNRKRQPKPDITIDEEHSAA